MKKFFRGALVPLALVTVALLTGCPDPGTGSNITDNTAALVNSVWAGEIPRPGDWLTITFKPGGAVVWSFSLDNTTNEWGYTFGTDNKGIVTTPAGVWNPCPNGFTVSGDTLTVANYGNHSGDLRLFKRVRQANLTIDTVPFTLGQLAADLAGSVWAGETPRTSDWLTISFKADGEVVWSFSFDNSTNKWGYTFDTNNKGTVINSVGGWNPCPNGFTVSGDTLTVANYGNHSGSPRSFKRYR